MLILLGYMFQRHNKKEIEKRRECNCVVVVVVVLVVKPLC